MNKEMSELRLNKSIISIIEEEPEIVLSMLNGNLYPIEHVTKTIERIMGSNKYPHSFTAQVVKDSFYKKEI